MAVLKQSLLVLILMVSALAKAGVVSIGLPKPSSRVVELQDFKSLSFSKWSQLIEENIKAPITKRFPGYSRGTNDFSGICGIPGPNSLIVGGNEATPHEYPWMAALYLTKSDGTYFCGGTLISDLWIMTAGHCIENALKVDIILGAHDLTNPLESGRKQLQGERFFTHPEWDTLTIQNDIALVKLPQAVEFSNSIRPICLPSYSEGSKSFAGLKAPISGWGLPSDKSQDVSNVLRETITDTITNLQCVLDGMFTVTSDMICISGDNGRSTCDGDSGGPLHKVEDTGRMKQIGITSFGSSLGCEKDFDAVFTRTASYLEFIETRTGIKIQP